MGAGVVSLRQVFKQHLCACTSFSKLYISIKLRKYFMPRVTHSDKNNYISLNLNLTLRSRLPLVWVMSAVI